MGNCNSSEASTTEKRAAARSSSDRHEISTSEAQHQPLGFDNGDHIIHSEGNSATSDQSAGNDAVKQKRRKTRRPSELPLDIHHHFSEERSSAKTAPPLQQQYPQDTPPKQDTTTNPTPTIGGMFSDLSIIVPNAITDQNHQTGVVAGTGTGAAPASSFGTPSVQSPPSRDQTDIFCIGSTSQAGDCLTLAASSSDAISSSPMDCVATVGTTGGTVTASSNNNNPRTEGGLSSLPSVPSILGVPSATENTSSAVPQVNFFEETTTPLSFNENSVHFQVHPAAQQQQQQSTSDSGLPSGESFPQRALPTSQREASIEATNQPSLAVIRQQYQSQQQQQRGRTIDLSQFLVLQQDDEGLNNTTSKNKRDSKDGSGTRVEACTVMRLTGRAGARRSSQQIDEVEDKVSSLGSLSSSRSLSGGSGSNIIQGDRQQDAAPKNRHYMIQRIKEHSNENNPEEFPAQQQQQPQPSHHHIVSLIDVPSLNHLRGKEDKNNATMGEDHHPLIIGGVFTPNGNQGTIFRAPVPNGSSADEHSRGESSSHQDSFYSSSLISGKTTAGQPPSSVSSGRISTTSSNSAFAVLGGSSLGGTSSNIINDNNSQQHEHQQPRNTSITSQTSSLLMMVPSSSSSLLPKKKRNSDSLLHQRSSLSSTEEERLNQRIGKWLSDIDLSPHPLLAQALVNEHELKRKQLQLKRSSGGSGVENQFNPTAPGEQPEYLSAIALSTHERICERQRSLHARQQKLREFKQINYASEENHTSDNNLAMDVGNPLLPPPSPQQQLWDGQMMVMDSEEDHFSAGRRPSTTTGNSSSEYPLFR